jgi:hypothetical protein
MREMYVLVQWHPEVSQLLFVAEREAPRDKPIASMATVLTLKFVDKKQPTSKQVKA